MRLVFALTLGLSGLPYALSQDYDTEPASEVTVIKKDGTVVEEKLGVGPYAGIQFGFNSAFDFQGTELFDGVVAGAVGGYDFGRWRLELDYAFRSVQVPTGGIGFSPFFGFVALTDGLDLHTVLGNVAYDIPVNDWVSFYGLAGGGLAVVDDFAFEDETFAFQGGVGLIFQPGHRFSVDLGYRYLQTGDLQDADNLQLNNAVFTFRYFF